MTIQVSAHGFDMTEALRTYCTDETEQTLQPLARHDFSIRWVLSQEGIDNVTHVHWNDGSCHGEATTRTDDMYSSIRVCVKKVEEQIKKTHDKKYDHHRDGTKINSLLET